MFLILIRHAETTANQIGLSQGWMDFPLSYEGREELMKKRDEIYNKIAGKFDIKRVFTSDLQRAYKTADAIFGGKKVAITRVAGLREINLGEASGMQKEQFRKLYPKHSEEIEVKGDLNLKYPNGESFLSFEKRIWNFTKKRIWQNIDSKKALVFVAHGGGIRMIYKNLLNLSAKEIWADGFAGIGNLELSCFEVAKDGENLAGKLMEI